MSIVLGEKELEVRLWILHTPDLIAVVDKVTGCVVSRIQCRRWNHQTLDPPDLLERLGLLEDRQEEGGT